MNHDEYEKFEGKKYIKELKQLWLHTRLFCELEDDPTSKECLHYDGIDIIYIWGMKKQNRIDILIRRVLIVLEMWKIFFWNN